MSRWTPLALALATLLAFPSPVPARPARTARPAPRTQSGLPPRDLATVVKSLDDDPDLVDEMLASDPKFRGLADAFLPASRGRMAGGRALIAIGAIGMILGALIGGSLYVAAPGHRTAAIGTLAGGIGGGILLFVPGVALAATPSGAERDLQRYWQDNRASFLRPEATTGPRLRFAVGTPDPRGASLPVLSIPF